jgi:uncharacterized membrane protein YqjE
MGLLLVTVFIIVMFWEDHRLAVLGGLCILFFVLGAIATFYLRNKERSKSKLFSISLAELAKDREQLEESNE